LDLVIKRVVNVHNAAAINPGETTLTFNGIPIDYSEFDIFALQALAVKEARYIEVLTKLGLKPDQIDSVLRNGIISITLFI
jgi:electron transfer flavoprotein alpha/beta subunit